MNNKTPFELFLEDMERRFKEKQQNVKLVATPFKTFIGKQSVIQGVCAN